MVPTIVWIMPTICSQGYFWVKTKLYHAVVKGANMPHLQHHGTDLCLEAVCRSWKVCVPSGTWNWVRRAQINLQHCSSGETVRDEHAKPVANYCLSVKIVRSCRDIGEMEWNRCHPCPQSVELVIVESFTAFLHGVLDSLGYHGTEPLRVHFCIF